MHFHITLMSALKSLMFFYNFVQHTHTHFHIVSSLFWRQQLSRRYAAEETSIGGRGFRKPFHRDVNGCNGWLVKQSPILESELGLFFAGSCDSQMITIIWLNILHEKPT